MAFVKITHAKKIGRIQEITEKIYMVPDKITCPEGDGIMSWDSYHGSYFCSCATCRKVITGKEFVEMELIKEKIKDVDVESGEKDC